MHLPCRLHSKDTGGGGPPKQKSNLRKREMWDTGSMRSNRSKKQMPSSEHNEDQSQDESYTIKEGSYPNFSNVIQEIDMCGLLPQTTPPQQLCFKPSFHLSTKCLSEPAPDSYMYLASPNHKLIVSTPPQHQFPIPLSCLYPLRTFLLPCNGYCGLLWKAGVGTGNAETENREAFIPFPYFCQASNT